MSLRIALTRSAAFAAVFAVAAVLAVGLRALLQQDPPLAAWHRLAGLGATGDSTALPPAWPEEPAADELRRPIAAGSPRQPAVRALPRLTTAILVAGDVHPAEEGRIALPAGARFALRLTASQAGTLEVLAINPEGARTSLWSVPVQRGAPVRSPGLRLEGTRGLETLRVVLRSGQGSPLAEQELQIWHL